MIETLPEITLMVVEKSQKGQEAFRRFFTTLGIRVLITSNPERALARLAAVPRPAHGIVFSSLELGEPAVDAFNSMAGHAVLRLVPAILIANPKQRALLERAECDDLRKIVLIPLTVPAVVAALTKVLDYEPPAASA